MSITEDFAKQGLWVWWLDGAALAAIENERGRSLPPCVSRWPEWLKDELLSMAGRPRRCRLWVAPHFGDISIAWATWGLSPMGDWLEALDVGGIVVDGETLNDVLPLPGIVTDLQLRVWGATK